MVPTLYAVQPARWRSRGHLSMTRQRHAAAVVMLVLSVAVGMFAGLVRS